MLNGPNVIPAHPWRFVTVVMTVYFGKQQETETRTQLSITELRLIRGIFKLLLLSLVATLCAFANADNQVTAKYWVGNGTPEHALDQLRSSNAQVGGRASLGFQSDPVWILFSRNSNEEPWNLLVQPVYIDSIQLYSVTPPYSQIASAGDREDKASDWNSYGHVFTHELLEGSDEFLIRISSKNTLRFAVTGESNSDLRINERNETLQTAFILSLLGFYLVWGAGQALIARDKILYLFVARQLCLISTLYVHAGWSHAWLGAYQDLVHNLLAISYIFIAQIFDYFLFKSYRLSRTLEVVILTILATFPIKAMLISIDRTSEALLLNNLTTLAGLIVFLIATFTIKQRNGVGIAKGWLCGYYLTQLAAPLMVFLIHGQTGSYDRALTSAAAMWYAAVQGTIIIALLSHYVRTIQSERTRLRTHADKLMERAKLEQERHQEISDLLAMLMHELKTPLATLTLAVQPTTQRSSTLVNNAISNMVDVLDQCGDLDSIERDRWQPRPSPIQVVELVNSLIEDEDLVEVAGMDGRLTTDRRMVTTVLRNLLRNAIKYRDSGSRVRIDWHWSQTHWILRITNAMRPGLALDDDKVFQKYYRHPQAQRQIGTGLGLYLSRLLTQKLHGELTAYSDGRLAIFELKLPNEN